MARIYVELKAITTPKTVDGSIKKGGDTYEIYVNENFDVRSRNDLQDLVNEINFQLSQDGIESVGFRNIERELMQVQIGKRVSIRID